MAGLSVGDVGVHFVGAVSKSGASFSVPRFGGCGRSALLPLFEPLQKPWRIGKAQKRAYSLIRVFLSARVTTAIGQVKTNAAFHNVKALTVRQ